MPPAAVTYAGVPLPVWTAEADAEILRAGLRLEDVCRFADDPPFSCLTLPFPPRMKPPPARGGVLWWPTGASQFARVHYLCDPARLTAIVDALRTLSGPTAGYKPATLTIGDGRVAAPPFVAKPPFSGPMHLLPPMPFLGSTRVYLLTLVDERYWWWQRKPVDLSTATGDWAGLFAALGTGLGTTVTVQGDLAAFAKPSAAWEEQEVTPLPLLLDAAAWSTGRRIIRSPAGVVTATDAQTSVAASYAVQSGWGPEYRLRGGGQAYNDDVRRNWPEKVLVIGDEAGFVVKLSDLALTAEYADVTGKTGYQATMHVDAKTFNDAQAKAWAKEWYRWLLSAEDVSFAGVAGFDPCGWWGAVEWIARTDEWATRVLPYPWQVWHPEVCALGEAEGDKALGGPCLIPYVDASGKIVGVAGIIQRTTLADGTVKCEEYGYCDPACGVVVPPVPPPGAPPPGSVTDGMLSNMPANTIKGRITAGAGSPENLTPPQVNFLLPVFGPVGAGHNKGLVPDPGAALVALTEDAAVALAVERFLCDDGTWKAITVPPPPVGGGMAIGGAVVGGTATRVLFEDTGPVLADSAKMVFNKTTGVLTPVTLSSAPISPATLTGNVNDYAPGVGRFYRLAADAPRSITGLSASQVTGQECEVWNVGANLITLRHEDAASLAANRFLCPGGANVTLAANEVVSLRYDGVVGRWRLQRGTPPGGTGIVTVEGGAYQTPRPLTGDVTTVGSGLDTTIADAAVTLAKMAPRNPQRLIGRGVGVAGPPEELTASQALDFVTAGMGAMLYRGASGWVPLDAPLPMLSQPAPAADSGATKPFWAATAGFYRGVLGSSFVGTAASGVFQQVPGFTINIPTSGTVQIDCTLRTLMGDSTAGFSYCITRLWKYGVGYIPNTEVQSSQNSVAGTLTSQTVTQTYRADFAANDVIGVEVAFVYTGTPSPSRGIYSDANGRSSLAMFIP